MTFKNMKFRVKDAEHSFKIQEKLFELGYDWVNSVGSHRIINTENHTFLQTQMVTSLGA